jgi:U4/U6.U5 tri-snRNP-associated protein 2
MSSDRANKNPSSLDENRNQRKRGARGKGGGDDDQIPACPYLDSVERTALDFDLERACSVSLETGPHIYGCLVCGRFFRGRGPRTAAYTHSVEESHFVFVHLSHGTFWCLPDGYEIRDPSLNDIRSALRPTFSAEQIEAIDLHGDLSRDLFGRRYLPGFVGLNNLKKTDCINSVVQALAHVPPLRDFFLAHREIRDGSGGGDGGGEQQPPRVGSSSGSKKRKEAIAAPPSSSSASSSHHKTAQAVTQAFGELVRKMWSPSRFRSTVDPHLFVQAVSTASHKRFEVGRQSEAGELLAWLLHQLHVGTGGGRKPGTSVVHRTFQGEVRVTTRQAKRLKRHNPSGRGGRKRGSEEVDDRAGSEDEGDKNHDDEEMADAVRDEDDEHEVVVEETTIDTHFLQLTLEIPEKPLFRDEDGGLVIPQEPFVNVLKKFDGVTFSNALAKSGAAQRKRYQLLRLPNYLILHLARFRENKYSREKNPAIVTFPIKNFDLTDYVHLHDDGNDNKSNGSGKANPPTAEEVRAMSVRSTARDMYHTLFSVSACPVHSPVSLSLSVVCFCCR